MIRYSLLTDVYLPDTNYPKLTLVTMLTNRKLLAPVTIPSKAYFSTPFFAHNGQDYF